MTTVVCTRHGETMWNRKRRVQGWAPTPLTDRGREQARGAGQHIAREYDLDRIEASDLRRTKETAQHIRSMTSPDTEPTYDRAWRERDFGVLQGLSYGEVFEGHPEYAIEKNGIGAARATPETGESLLDMRERVLAGWDRLLAEADPDETVLVVTHGGPLYIILGHVRGWDIVRSILDLDQGNCTINEIRVRNGDSEIARENERPQT